MNRENNLKIERSEVSHNINANDQVYKTNLGRYTKITHIARQSENSEPCIKKINKNEYVDLRTGEIKQYNLKQPTSLESVKRKWKKYEEMVLCNFLGGKNEVFITLTCKEHITDIAVIKKYYRQFIKKLKKQTEHKNIEHIGLFEQSANGRLHIHTFVKTPENSIYRN